MKKNVIILLIAALLLCLTACRTSPDVAPSDVAPSDAAPSDAAPFDAATADQSSDTPHNLVSRVKRYYKDTEQSDWELMYTTRIKYDRAYPILFRTVMSGFGENADQTECTYTFEGDLPVTRVETEGIPDTGTTVEYKNGRPDTVTFERTEMKVVSKGTYQYDDSSHYYTKEITEVEEASRGQNSVDKSESVASVEVKTENGLLRSTVTSLTFYTWENGEKKQDKDLSATPEYIEYDEEGIVEQIYDVEEDTDSKNFWERFIVTRDGGRITEVVCQRYDVEDRWTDQEKLIFEYNDTEISPSRYSLMMNWFIAKSSSVYEYFWY